MKVIFNTINEDVPLKNHDGIAFRILVTVITLMAGVGIAIIFNLGKLMILLLFAIIAISGFWFGRRLLPDWIREKDFSGELHLKSKEIMLSDNNGSELFNLEDLA